MAKPKLESEIIAFIKDNLSKMLPLDTGPINIHTPLTEYGINSIDAINLSAVLETYLGIEVEPTVVWDYPSVQQMATALVNQIAEPATKIV